jgi:hypothetical protein
MPAHVPLFRRPASDPLAATIRQLERQGGVLVAVAHLCATLMIVLFSLGSLVALSGDAFATLVLTVHQGGTPALPQAISIAVSTLMVVCCDVGLVYAAMVLRAPVPVGRRRGICCTPVSSSSSPSSRQEPICI